MSELPPPSGQPIGPSPPPRPQSRPSIKIIPGWSEARQLMLGGAIAMGVGTLLPWVKASAGFLQVSVAGYDTSDGQAALAIAVGCALLVALKDETWARVLAGVGFAGITAVAWIDKTDIEDLSDEVQGAANVTAGIGLWVTIIGGLVGAIAAVMAFADDRIKPSPPDEQTDTGGNL